MRSGLVTELEGTNLPRHQQLRAAISASGVRQFAVASRVGISESQLSKILSGRKPLSDDLAGRIVNAITELAA